MDIDCIIVSAGKEMNHAWNIVSLNGVDYHVDTTWNDPIPNREGYVRYKYLNVSDEQMKKLTSGIMINIPNVLVTIIPLFGIFQPVTIRPL